MRGTLERLAALGLEALEASVKDGEAVFRAEPEGVEERLPREALEKALGFLEEEALAFLEELASAEGEVEARLDLKRGELRVRWRTFQEEEWSLGKEAWKLPLRLSLEARREGEAKGRGLATKGKLLDFERCSAWRPGAFPSGTSSPGGACPSREGPRRGCGRSATSPSGGR